jgi:hypothetical protein
MTHKQAETRSVLRLRGSEGSPTAYAASRSTPTYDSDHPSRAELLRS